LQDGQPGHGISRPRGENVKFYGSNHEFSREGAKRYEFARSTKTEKNLAEGFFFTRLCVKSSEVGRCALAAIDLAVEVKE
jgi:hypothetical protein